MSAEEAEPFIKFEAESGPQAFFSLAELNAFLEQETAWWQSVRQKIHGQAAPPLNAWDEALRNIRTQLNAISAEKPSEDAQRLLAYDRTIRSAKQQLTNALSGIYKSGAVFTSASGTGQFVAKYLDSDPQILVGLLYGVTKQTFQTPNWNDPIIWHGFIIGILYTIGHSDRLPFERKAIENLATEWRGIFETIRSNQVKARAETVEHNAQHAEQIKSQKDELAELIAAQKTELKQLRTWYEQELSLQAPIQYWKHKAAAHRNAAIWWGAFYSGAANSLAGVTFISRRPSDLRLKRSRFVAV